MNGSFTVTGCKAGTYIIEELSSDGSHVIDTPPQTVYLSGKDQEVVQVYFNNSPKGSLLIKKVSSADNSPISDVQFFVTESDGTVVGDSNGYFVTDSAGTILIEGIDPGTTLVVKETRAKDGFILDDTPQTAQIQAGQTVTSGASPSGTAGTRRPGGTGRTPAKAQTPPAATAGTAPQRADAPPGVNHGTRRMKGAMPPTPGGTGKSPKTRKKRSEP